MVTLPSSCTSCTETLLTSLRRAVFVAVTSTWLPEVNSARTSPLTPLISMSFPRWTTPDQWKSSDCDCAPAMGAANRTNSDAAISLRIQPPGSVSYGCHGGWMSERDERLE